MIGILLCSLFIVLALGSNDPVQIQCPSFNSTITPDLALPSNTYYYPYPFDQNSTISSYTPNQFCKFIVEIPKLQYAYFTMMADINDDSMLTITDCNGKSEIVMTSEFQPYVFVGGQFSISLLVGTNGNNTRFAFQVQWSDFPTPNPAFYTVTKTGPALFFDEMLFENSVTITAETRATIVAFPSTYPDFTPLLRITLVFDGPDLNSPYLGTLFQALRSNKPMVSKSRQMTIFTFQENYLVGSNFVVQDYYNVQNLSESRGITCWSQSSCPVTLNAANGPVSAMTLNADDGDEYIKRLDLSPGSILKIYCGAKKEDDDSNLIVTYNAEQSKTNIPQKFYGDIMTYYLANGTALVELAEDSNYTRWNDASSGREGFMSSRKFGELEFYQDVYEEIGGFYLNSTFQFEVNVTHLDVSNVAVLTLTFGNETGSPTIHQISNSTNFQLGQVIEAVGRNMTVSYFTNGTATNGFFLNFKISSLETKFANFKHPKVILVISVLSMMLF